MEEKAVYKAINAVQTELAKEGISKDRRNSQQNYSFRGIDDVYNALSPLLAKHHLCILPRVLKREATSYESKTGGTIFSVGDLSVTGAILPVRIRQLEIRHPEEIVEDVADGIWRLIGSVGHKILERADTTNHLAEERLTARVAGWVISGKADLLGPDMTLDDYKFRSVWAMLNAKVEDEQQLNGYAWLYRKNGFEVKRARIVAPLRDWSKLRVEREPDYPQVGVVVREILLWTPQQQEEFVTGRIINHQIAEGIPDDELPPCTLEERWHKPDTWAVKKKGNKRAHRVYSSLLEAETNQPAGYEIEHRPGVDTRCASYCRVAQFCALGRAIRAAHPVPIAEEAA